MTNANTGFVHRNAALLSVEMGLPQVTVTSDEIDEMLAPARKRLRLPKGVLQRVAGVYERRWWRDREDGGKQGSTSSPPSPRPCTTRWACPRAP